MKLKNGKSLAMCVLLFSGHLFSQNNGSQKDDGTVMTLSQLWERIPIYRIITRKMYDGKIYIADFFFTSCPTICPSMHKNMLRLYHEFSTTKQLCFLSHTIDFKNDTAEVLKQYAVNLGVTDQRWQFVRGEKQEVYNLAEKSYLSAVATDSGAPGGYIHSGYLVLVDKQKRIRGMYLGIDDAEVANLERDVKTLLLEE